ncbi:hypothetical protein O3P69_004655 [Scylla paramamosain]|uniref:Uncharacterized protein n=1 Tax=Scylla paramamosain TaxID=85552 RepID=A0AAW0UEJ8_SCYPA
MSLQEVDIGLGPFTVTTDRATAVDFTYPVEVTSGRILAGQKKLEVDPWGFALPLSPEGPRDRGQDRYSSCRIC